MSIPQPLEVRLRTARADRYVTAELRGLRWRTVSPGGFAWARLTLDRPLTIQPDEIAPFGDLFVYDARDARTAFEGRLEDPARGAGRDGQVWELAAVGPAAHAHDRNVALIYVDRSLGGWSESFLSHREAQLTKTETLTDTPSLVAGIAEGGSMIAVGDAADWQYTPIFEAGMLLGRVSCNGADGIINANAEHRILTRITPSGGGTTRASGTLTTVPYSMVARRGTEFVTNDDVCNLRAHRINAVASTGSNAYAEFSAIAVRSVLKDKLGADITTGYSLTTVLASDIVADLLGRLLPKFDGAGATIATTTHAIEQLAYPDGVDPASVLDDLMLLEPAFTWEAYESNAAGKYRFAWRAWPTTVRYDADVDDGYESTGSAVDLYNAVNVRWTDPRGRIRITRRTQVVPDLDAAGLTREPQPIDLGDNLGSLANAQRVGDQFLAEHKSPPNAGRLVIARPVYDHLTGSTVMPWDILPGYLIRVAGILPRVDALNPSGRDGSTIFKIAAMEYDTGDAQAELELDSYPPTVTRALAELARRKRTTGGPQRRR